LYSLNPGFAEAVQIKEAVERLLGGVHFRESRLEAGAATGRGPALPLVLPESCIDIS
jgi:hypothetical protein